MDLCTLSKGVEKNLSTLSKYTEWICVHFAST
jgi:hypothetical protein